MKRVINDFITIFNRGSCLNETAQPFNKEDNSFQIDNSIFSLRMKNHRPHSLVGERNPMISEDKCYNCTNDRLSGKYHHLSFYKDESMSLSDSKGTYSDLNITMSGNRKSAEEPIIEKAKDKEDNESIQSFSFRDNNDNVDGEEPSFYCGKQITIEATVMRLYYGKLCNFVRNKEDYYNYPQVDYPNYTKVMKVLCDKIDFDYDRDTINRKDIAAMYSDNILSEKLMSLYLKLIKLRELDERSNNPSSNYPFSFIMPIGFSNDLHESKSIDYLQAKYFTFHKSLININKYDLIIIPIKHSNTNHWDIITLSIKSHLCLTYPCPATPPNPLYSYPQTITNIFDSLLSNTHQWTYETIAPIPHISKHISCILPLVTLNYLSRNKPMNISPVDLMYYIILIIIEVLNGKLYTY